MGNLIQKCCSGETEISELLLNKNEGKKVETILDKNFRNSKQLDSFRNISPNYSFTGGFIEYCGENHSKYDIKIIEPNNMNLPNNIENQNKEVTNRNKNADNQNNQKQIELISNDNILKTDSNDETSNVKENIKKLKKEKENTYYSYKEEGKDQHYGKVEYEDEKNETEEQFQNKDGDKEEVKLPERVEGEKQEFIDGNYEENQYEEIKGEELQLKDEDIEYKENEQQFEQENEEEQDFGKKEEVSDEKNQNDENAEEENIHEGPQYISNEEEGDGEQYLGKEERYMQDIHNKKIDYENGEIFGDNNGNFNKYNTQYIEEETNINNNEVEEEHKEGVNKDNEECEDEYYRSKSSSLS